MKSSIRHVKKSIYSRFPGAYRFPREEKRPQERSDEDADDDVPVVVHGQQHDEIRNRELGHMERGPDKLLEQRRPHRAVIDTSSGGGGDIGVRTLVRGRGRGAVTFWDGSSCSCRRRQRGHLPPHTGTADDVGVVFAAHAAQEFKNHDEADDTDAGAAEHAVGGDVPVFGDEACYGISEMRVAEWYAKKKGRYYRNQSCSSSTASIIPSEINVFT